MEDVVIPAMTIQRAVRIFLAKNELSKRKAKQKEYDQIMEKLQKEVSNGGGRTSPVLIAKSERECERNPELQLG